jgi:aminopeptidase N
MLTRRILRTAAPLALGGLWLASAFAHTPETISLPEPEHASCRRAEILARTRTLDPSDDRDLDVLHYDLSIDVGESDISGTLTLRALPLVAGLSTVVLDLYDTYTIDALASSSHGVASSTRAEHFLTIQLANAAALGDTIDVAVTYRGTPPVVSGFIAQRPFTWGTHGQGTESAPVIFTLSVPNRSGTWWPCKEQLEDKATIDIAATVDAALVVASNGVFQGSEPAGPGRTRFRWSHRIPIVPYLVCLAISNYVVQSASATIDVNGTPEAVPIEYYVYPEHAALAAVDFTRVPEAIEFYSSLFGPYPFWSEKFAMAEIPWSGGMEHQTCVSLGDRFVRGTQVDEKIYVHELSHQWFGDWVAVRDLRDIWINEGFATYCEALWEEHLGGSEAYFEKMRRLDPFPPPGSTDFAGTIWDPSPLYGTTPYQKGAWVLHMLRFAIGDEAFFETLRTYLDQQAGGNGSTDEFREVAEAISGRSLATFFDQWLMVEGRPLYAMEWESNPSGLGYETRVTVQQQQSQRSVYEMPIHLGLVSEGGTTFEVVENTERLQTFVFEVTEPTTAILFDPENRLLKPTSLYPLVQPSEIVAFRRVLPNPMAADAAITYRLNVGGRVRLTIFDVAGRIVRRLVDSSLPAQDHTIVWDGRRDNGEAAAQGTYFLELRSGGTRESRVVTKVE